MGFLKRIILCNTLFVIVFALFLPSLGIQAYYADPDDVIVDGNYAYLLINVESLGRFSGGLQIVDITDPTNPQFVSHFKMENYGYHICKKDNYIVMFSVGFIIHIIDVTEPEKPRITGTYDVGEYARSMFVSGNYLYVACGTFEIIDLSNPQNPTKIFSYSDYIVRDVAVSNNEAFLACFDYGIIVFDVTYPHAPSFCGSYAYPDANQLCVENNIAYVKKESFESTNFLVLDVTDTYSIAQLDTYNDNVNSRHFSVSENMIYYTYHDDLKIINAVNPSSLYGYPEFDINEDYIPKFYADSGFVYYLSRTNFGIINATNPYNPEKISSFPLEIPYFLYRNIAIIVPISVILIGLTSLIVVRRKKIGSNWSTWKEKRLESNKSPFAIASIVSSVISIPTLFIPFAGYGILPGLLVVALICGLISLRVERNKRLAKIALIINAAGFVLGIILMLGLSFLLFYIWN